MFIRGRQILRYLIMAGVVLALGGAVWGVVAWATYPKVPNVAKVEVTEAIAFVGTDDFNRMTESHRKKYLLGIAERLKEKTFPELLELMLAPGGDPKSIQKNVGQLKDKDEVGGAFMRVGLDKFFEQTREQQDTYFAMWAMAEKIARAGGDPSQAMAGRPGFFRRPTTKPAGPKTQPAQRPALPSPERFEKEMTKFLSTQPPRTTAQMSELMNAMRRKRAAFGLPDQ